MTARNDWVAHLMHYPLKELRRRQSIINMQIPVAHKQGKSEVLDNMNNMLDSITEAIMTKYCNDKQEIESGTMSK